MRHKFRVYALVEDDDGCKGYLETDSSETHGLHFFFDGGYRGISYFLKHSSSFRVEQWTGLTDIHGQEIYEGDGVAVYPENYEKTKITEDIYEIHRNKLLPLKDILIYKGKVAWEAPEFRILVDKNANGVISVGMKDYWLEIIKD